MSRRSSFSLVVCLALLLASFAAVAPASAASDVEHRAVEDPLFGVSSVVPADWQALGNGTYARGTPPQDLALIVIQSAAIAPDDLWAALLPQLGLDERPESTGSLSAGDLDWTLYQTPVTAGQVALTIELALLDDGPTTYLILLQSAPEEFGLLRENVFVPAVEAFAALAPEVTPDPATLGYLVEEVAFPGGSEGVELAGTLTLPEGPGPHPGVVLMSGSGAQDRDESLRPAADLKPFALVADALTSAGLAVLRYDDRGVGGSSGDYEAATIQDLAADGGAALAYLRARSEVDPARVGLLGHSEGGIYAAMLAADDPDVAFVALMAAPAVDGVQLIVAQQEAIARAGGANAEETEAAREAGALAMPLARDGDAEGLEAALRDAYGAYWDRRTADERTLLGDRGSFVDRQVKAAMPSYQSDWFRSLLAYDPTADWERVQAPVLGLYGGRDVQVLEAQNAPALRAALEAGGNADVEVVVFPDANHLFQASITGAVQEYGTLASEFTAGFLPTLVGWITEQVGLASSG